MICPFIFKHRVLIIGDARDGNVHGYCGQILRHDGVQSLGVQMYFCCAICEDILRLDGKTGKVRCIPIKQ